MRVFLDTNVLVSALVARGLCADLVRRVLAEHVLLVGEVVLVELRRVLRDRLHVPYEIAMRVERDLRSETVVPRPKSPSALPIRDPDDRWIVASAEAAKADLLVTGDRDLLAVAGQASLRIVSPRTAWESLGKSRWRRTRTRDRRRVRVGRPKRGAYGATETPVLATENVSPSATR